MNTATTTTVRDAFLHAMRGFGMNTIFGNPGSTELPMFRDFPADMRYVLGLQESAVVAMADGYAQATNNAAMVNLHSAVGVGHAMGSIFTAFKNQTPLIITAGQQARSILPFDPFLCSANATDLPKPYVKWACEPARAEDVPLALAKGYHIAMAPPRGPVLISIPADDWDRPATLLEPRTVSQATAPCEQALGALVAALDRARNPAIIAGAGIARDRAVEPLVELATRHQALVYAAPMSARCAFPERHPLFGGFLPAIRERIVTMLAQHDFLLVLGAPAFTYHIEGTGPHIPADATLWQVVDAPDTAAWTPVGNAIIASPGLAVQRLLTITPPPSRPAPTGRAAPAPAQDSLPMSTAYVLQTLDQVRSAHDVVVEEAPSARPVMHQYLPMPGQEAFYTMASGGLGWAMPAAVGVALARQAQGQKGRTICLIGDGSSMYSIQALYTAAQWQLPITFLVLNNQRYAALQDFATVFQYRPNEKPQGTDLPGLDFVQLAQAQAVPGKKVQDPAYLASALEQALSATGPNLIEAAVL